MGDVVAAAPPVRIPVRGGGTFPVRRIYCVGRNFAEHAREMGVSVPTSAADRGSPVFFCKPADAIVLDGQVPYPRGTRELHHEVELVVAIGRDAGPDPIAPADAASYVFGYALGLDLTRRDLQTEAKAKGLPWDTGKAFDHSAPISEIVPAGAFGDVAARAIELSVNGRVRQHSGFDDLVWTVPEIVHELSRLFALRAGDLVFMGTPAGVGPLVPGDFYAARIDAILELRGQVSNPR